MKIRINKPENTHAVNTVIWVPSIDKYDGMVVNSDTILTSSSEDVYRYEGWYFHHSWLTVVSPQEKIM